MQKRTLSHLKSAAILILFVAIIFYLLRIYFDFTNITNMEYVVESISEFGNLAPVIFIVIMAIAIIISPIPSLPLSAVAGAIWGPFLATIYSVIGALIGAVISFSIARNLGRDFVEKKFKQKIPKRYTEKTLTWTIFVARLFPFFQFDIVSYGAGLTKISLKNFTIATFFGMIPMTYVFTKFGEEIFLGNVLVIVATIIMVILMFTLPVFLKKHKLFKRVN